MDIDCRQKKKSPAFDPQSEDHEKTMKAGPHIKEKFTELSPLRSWKSRTVSNVRSFLV